MIYEEMVRAFMYYKKDNVKIENHYELTAYEYLLKTENEGLLYSKSAKKDFNNFKNRKKIDKTFRDMIISSYIKLSKIKNKAISKEKKNAYLINLYNKRDNVNIENDFELTAYKYLLKGYKEGLFTFTAQESFNSHKSCTWQTDMQFRDNIIRNYNISKKYKRG